MTLSMELLTSLSRPHEKAGSADSVTTLFDSSSNSAARYHSSSSLKVHGVYNFVLLESVSLWMSALLLEFT
ncbi:hypothetical protein RchiOBHm_Chr5g0037111 [Rosa chinensis]|uniref:Uncharacterized protein n=1 Tax=Rosa chinensis TaxID=74649 RepID=A0A2P6QBN2_ROSCH|nr:hypothetical protein RchiOBHm_Chr5g0037111 [Rosa chinensis]